MSFFARLALLFVVVPIVELVILIQLGRAVGLGPTVALVILTGVGGAMLARAEGLRVLLRFQRELAEGRLPGQSLLDGVCILVGGAFLLTPGILTDVAGFVLLLPPTRRVVQRIVRRRLERRIADGTIRVVTARFGPGGFGFGAYGGRGEGGAPDAGDPLRRLDPRKGIDVD